MDIGLDLMMQDPIEFNGTTIYQPTIAEIKKYKLNKFSELLIPFSITLEVIDINLPEEEKSKIHIFDVVFKDEHLFHLLINAILFFCRTDNIIVDKYGIHIDECYITRDNFDEFSDIILKITNREKIKVEKQPVFENDRQRDVWQKLQEGRKRNAKKEEFLLQDIVNIVQFGGRYRIPINEIKNMTLWTLMNAYKTILNLDNCDSMFQVYLISGEKSLIETHWSQQIKIS